MRNFRLIARLDIKGPNLIKGIQLEGLRVIGSPNEHALRYYLNGIDELISDVRFCQAWYLIGFNWRSLNAK